MGRMTGIKWEKSTQCRPVHNIISSDFPKYNPQPWKFMTKTAFGNEVTKIETKEYAGQKHAEQEGPSRVQWLLSYEYQRMWLEEREMWNKRMYPENTTVNVDVVKRYVLTFKTNHQPQKPAKKKPFKMRKFENVGSKTSNKRLPGDKAMNFNKKKEAQKNR